MTGGWAFALGLWFAMGLAQGAAAQGFALGETVQNAAILTVDSDRLFSRSAFGLRISQELQDESAALEAENRRIEAELAQEEKALTDQRPEMDPAEFRALADAFDAKVQRIRLEQGEKSQALNDKLARARQLFIVTAGPAIERMMQEAGALVVMEQRGVFMSARVIDITDEAIARIDAEIGDGAGLELPAQEAATEEDGGEAPQVQPVPVPQLSEPEAPEQQ